MNATTGICQYVRRPATIAATSVAIATARTASAAIIMRRRSRRSAATPAGSAKIVDGTMRANVTMPARAGEPVSASTSSG